MEGSGQFMLARAVVPAVRPAAPQPAQPVLAPQVAPEAIELAFWQSIQASRNVADFDEYLRRYPNGLFCGPGAQPRCGTARAAAAAPPRSQR